MYTTSSLILLTVIFTEWKEVLHNRYVKFTFVIQIILHHNLWSLEERRNRADLIEVFRICHGQSGIECEKLFERVEDSKTRGHPLHLKRFWCKLDLRIYFFSERIVDRWNSLDEDTVSACNSNSLKNRLVKLRQKRKGFFMDTQ